ncbi:MAG: hypothetical protein SNH73_06770 [Rikenellaceae bacterium]
MRMFKCIVLLSFLAFTLSCKEALPEDQSDRFAAMVVYDLYENSLQLPLSDISTIHKASTWLDNIDNESARYEIENLYFSKIAPRAKNNIVTVITSNSGAEISVEHNNISIVEAGAIWSISADGSASKKKITISNIDGEQWLCTQEEPNGDISLRLTIAWSAIDNYTFTMDGNSTIVYANSPVTAQNFVSTSILAAKTLCTTPYPIGTSLTIIDGSFTIELLDEVSNVIEADDIDVTFLVNSVVSPDYVYYDNMFNPLIGFRGNIFYYSDLYSRYYW